MKPQTLMVAIQCVASEIKSLDLSLEKDQVEGEAETSEQLVNYDLALEELKRDYELALKEFSGFPTNDELLISI